jgi:hypothetical protein
VINTYKAVGRKLHSLSFLLNNPLNQRGVGTVVPRVRDGRSRDHALIPAGSTDLSLLQIAPNELWGLTRLVIIECRRKFPCGRSGLVMNRTSFLRRKKILRKIRSRLPFLHTFQWPVQGEISVISCRTNLGKKT